MPRGGNPNILFHRDAMKADDYEQFLKSMKNEIDKLLENEIYEIVPRHTVPRSKTVLNAVWSHRRKTTPNGIVYRYRSRVCDNGSQQKYGHDFMDTYSPLVSWTTVQLLLVLSITLNLQTRQVDYVQIFSQAVIDEDI